MPGASVFLAKETSIEALLSRTFIVLFGRF